jgi:DNA repair protein RadA/Sms
LPPDAVFFGEISLSGAVRPVAQASARLKEATKLGFTRAYLPESTRSDTPRSDTGIQGHPVSGLTQLVADIAARGRGKKDTPGRLPRQNP